MKSDLDIRYLKPFWYLQYLGSQILAVNSIVMLISACIKSDYTQKFRILRESDNFSLE